MVINSKSISPAKRIGRRLILSYSSTRGRNILAVWAVEVWGLMGSEICKKARRRYLFPRKYRTILQPKWLCGAASCGLLRAGGIGGWQELTKHYQVTRRDIFGKNLAKTKTTTNDKAKATSGRHRPLVIFAASLSIRTCTR